MNREKVRFKDQRFNKIYWLHVNATEAQIKEMMHPKGNWDQAFRDGFMGGKCKYQRNWTLYPIYIAGKEWRKVNKVKSNTHRPHHEAGGGIKVVKN